MRSPMRCLNSASSTWTCRRRRTASGAPSKTPAPRTRPDRPRPDQKEQWPKLPSFSPPPAGAVHSFWVFIAMFAVLGLANTVYHPADYTLLSERVSPRRMTQVFSFHTCSGMIGSAIAPVSLLFMQSAVGWRGAFLCSALLGVVAALVLAVQGEPPVVHPAHPSKPRGEEPASWQLLLSPPILLNLLFFVVLSMVGGGLNQYLVVGLGALYGTPPALANTALTGLLAMSAMGVLL